MRGNYSKYHILFFCIVFNLTLLSQVTQPSNCEKEGVILYSVPDCNNRAYELLFEDEFDGSALDTSKWERTCCYYGGLQGGQHVEYNSLDNIELLNGVCRITAKKETVTRRVTFWYDSAAILEDGLPNLRTFDYTSGSMWTKKTFFHGRFEAKCRMPNSKGLWPAFWMYGGIRGNEIDVFDSYAGADKLVTNILHDYDGSQKSYQCSERFSGYDFTQWHTFTCVFEYDKISFLVDDKLVRVVHRIVTVDGGPVKCGDEIATGSYFFLKSYPIERMHVIFNLALTSISGPAGSTAVDASTELPAHFEIDYVKIWKRGEETETFFVTPNPASDKINVSSDHVIKYIRITGLNGQVIGEYEIEADSKLIDISMLQDGMYFITAFFEGSLRALKMIKRQP